MKELIRLFFTQYEAVQIEIGYLCMLFQPVTLKFT